MVRGIFSDDVPDPGTVPDTVWCCPECGDWIEDGEPDVRMDREAHTATHFECLSPDVFCTKHGKPLFSEGGSYCEDCEPPEYDGEQMTGAERASLEREQMAHIQRTLK